MSIEREDLEAVAKEMAARQKDSRFTVEPLPEPEKLSGCAWRE